MGLYLGLDTSNYTTSAAIYDTDTQEIQQSKKLLPVKHGEKGLRQSDAVFHHTVQLPEVLAELQIPGHALNGIGVSVRPRNIKNSYMPCFLCGEGLAQAFGQILQIPVFKTSHQIGHILAALYSSGKLSWIDKPFLAFHVSGGTTDCILCKPDEDLFSITPVSSSLDLKAGQLIDRVGLMLGLHFPCGMALEQLAMQSRQKFRYKPVMKQADCCLSGLENQCARMQKDGIPACDIALFCLTAVSEVLIAMTQQALKHFPEIPVLYAGGVMADQYIQNRLKQQIYSEIAFAEPEFSCDNAAGTAIYAALHGCSERF